jgi:hypothetical protein
MLRGVRLAEAALGILNLSAEMIATQTSGYTLHEELGSDRDMKGSTLTVEHPEFKRPTG